jgi:hypothetical protein
MRVVLVVLDLGGLDLAGGKLVDEGVVVVDPDDGVVL